jgi:hypothetical protein
MGVSLDHGHRHTHIHKTSSSISARSTTPVVSCGQTVVQDGVSRERFHQLQTTGGNLAAAISRPSLRPGKKRGAPQGRHSCSICKLDYAQPQGLTRHQREKHKARLCMYCREYSWARPYLFKEHLLRRHPGIDPGAAIEGAIGSVCGAAVRRYIPQQRVSISPLNMMAGVVLNPKRSQVGSPRPCQL